MNLSKIWPTRFHAASAWLGKDESWLSSSISEDGLMTMLDIRWDRLINRPGFIDHKSEIKAFFGVDKISHVHIAIVDAICASISGGLKIFSPTAEQFEAMQNVELNITMSEYRQPYPAMFVKIPQSCREVLAKGCGLAIGDCPEVVLCRHRTGEVSQMVLVHFFRESGNPVEMVHFLSDRIKEVSIEHGLLRRIRSAGEDPKQYQFTEASGRAVINLMMMLTYYGSRLGEPLCKREYDYHRRDPKVAHLKHGDFRAVEMVQDIVVRAESRQTCRGEPTGEIKAPHWRRGHWRRQRCGVGNQDTRTIFIKPILIHEDWIVGDLSDSRSEYRVKESSR